MDPSRFDTLVRTLSTGPSRRRLLGVLSVLPLVGTVLVTSDEDISAKGKRKTRRKDHGARTEAPSCAQRCRRKSTKRARRKCRKRCTPPTPECTTSQDCPSGELCESGVCIPIPDQCGNDTDCDACERCESGVCVARCAPGEVCRANQCETIQCQADRDCGDCSRCQDGRCRWQCAVTEVCLSGAGGRCCQPRSCPAGLDCGTVDDGCGGTARCGSGTCTAPDTCGGGNPGTPNVCGCTDSTCPVGATCGEISNVCGGTIDCGGPTCSGTTPVCSSDNVCVACSGANPCPTGQCCASDGSCGACLVFVTSATSTGNLGGLAGADQTCQDLAEAAGLPGDYLAWLSDSTGSPSTRFVQATVPYQRRDGVKVANDWADLIDGSLTTPINVTETGGAPPAVGVWTGTAANGTLSQEGWTCEDWTLASGGSGLIGQNNSTGSIWTRTTGVGCAGSEQGSLPLYCFQQS